MNKYDSVRIYKDEMETHSAFQTKYRIEFVVNKSKSQKFLTMIFGNIYNVGRSRYNDGLVVSRPQDYWDFLAFLKEIKVSDEDILAYNMELGKQKILSNNHTTFYEPNLINNGAISLIEFASDYLVDTSLSYDQQEQAKKKFINKCYEILQNLGIQVYSQEI